MVTIDWTPLYKACGKWLFLVLCNVEGSVVFSQNAVFALWIGIIAVKGCALNKSNKMYLS